VPQNNFLIVQNPNQRLRIALLAEINSDPCRDGNMNNEDQIKIILLNILKIGLLRIRALGSNSLPEQCFIEADHLHNLPGLIQSLQMEELNYYFRVERPAFLGSAKSSVEDFQSQWDLLEKLIAAANARQESS